VILVDIDNFKDINDTYGHGVGDQALRIVADRLKASVREVDILGRYGGDEFVILLPETEGPAASAAAERIRYHLAEPIAIKGGNPSIEGSRSFLNITASLGIASLGGQPQDVASLIARADIAAYAAKQSGRNRIELG
jgi:diguanylate cyclase (GGDEF)-like protein